MFFIDSERSPLKIVTKGKYKALIPEFICGSVINCFKQVKFYNVTRSGLIDLANLLSKIDDTTEIILIMHYFGSLQPLPLLKEIKTIAQKKDIILIEDMTNGIFSAEFTVGDYMIASLRKWFPIPLGGVLYSKNALPLTKKISKSSDNKRLYGIILKDLYLRDDLDFNSLYCKIFIQSEEKLDNKKEPELLSDLSRFIISCFDVKKIKQRRQENYRYLTEGLSELSLFPICPLAADDCPFVFPLRMKERNKFRKFLIANRIYAAVHWSFDGFQEECRPMAVCNSNELISLPIDQRYQEEYEQI